VPTISIALTTLNGQKFLPQQLASLAAQQVPVLELVVCDDNS
jgi:glycosyltransferase involved in cell wall biosynthesis